VSNNIIKSYSIDPSNEWNSFSLWFENNNIKNMVTNNIFMINEYAFTEDGETNSPLPGTSITIEEYTDGNICGFNIVQEE